jgi:MOSC domain-containing protein YiiM
MGTIVQVNVSRGGVPKLPVAAAQATVLGLAGDKHLYKFHGGASKALLLLPSEIVDALRAEGFSVYYGALGENLTTKGLDHRTWQPGQRFQAGDVVLELTEEREPCRKLNPYGKGIQRRIYPGASGFYASVLHAGVIRTGDAIYQLPTL